MNDVSKEIRMVFTEVCEDKVYRPVSVDVHKVTNIKKLADARHQDDSLGEYKAYTSIEYDGREILLLDSVESVISALDATRRYLMYLDIGVRVWKRQCEMEKIMYQVERPPA